jgi:hypothetical protein
VHFKVYLLRRRGRRLPWREVQNGRTYLGRLVTHLEQHNGEQYSVLQLEPSDPMSADRPPALYEPVLLGFAPLAFRLRGFERIEGEDGGYSVVREWHVEAGNVVHSANHFPHFRHLVAPPALRVLQALHSQ